MNVGKKIKSGKYIPVRKQLKAISKTNVCQSKLVNGGLVRDKAALPDVA